MTYDLFKFCLVLGLVSLANTALSDEPADTLYLGGSIITVNDAQPSVEAVAVRNGKIIAAGNLTEMEAYRAATTREVNLGGRTLLPGFVDSHGHAVMGGLQAIAANLLAPPDGGVTNIATLQSTLASWTKRNQSQMDAFGLIIGFGYDESQLAEQRPPDRWELDEVARDVPIVIVHQSGHFGVANSAALEKAGITRSSTPPPGGVIRFGTDSEPTGVLEENAFFMVLGMIMGDLGAEGLKTFARAGTNLWASFGYTTGQEGRSSAAAVEALKQMAASGEIPIDVVAYPDVLTDREYILNNASKTYVDGVRVGGAKLTIDGSPQGFTALRDKPYYNPVGDYQDDYAGYAAASMQQTQDAINWAYEHDIQIMTHANGEGASDMLIEAITHAQDTHGSKPLRPVLIHGQFLREDQVDSYQALGVFPSLFPMHTFYWGDWHREHTVGPVAAENISPTGWLVDRGMMFGTHHDAPVAFPDSMRVLDATVTRRTRSGDILGPTQRVNVMTALKAMTIWPAWQHFEEDSKGSIEVGKLADFVILSDNPLTVDPEHLDRIKVVKTIKEDRVIYENSGDTKQTGFNGFTNHQGAHEVLEAVIRGAARQPH